MKLLLTGASGLIGSAALERLRESHEITALNRSAVPDVRTHRADISDFESIRPAFANQDLVVHLAAKAGENFTWEELRDTNVEGTRHVFQAACDAGVQRVVFASSGATVAGWEFDEPYRSLVNGDYGNLATDWPLITIAMSPRPRGVYGSTKVWGESLASHYSATTATSFINIRIGYVNGEDQPTNPRQRSVWCSQRDVVNAIDASINAPANLRLATFFANSENRYGYRDLTHGAKLVGWHPMDSAEDHAP